MESSGTARSLRQRKFDSKPNPEREALDDDAKHNTIASQGWGAFVLAFLLATGLCLTLVVIILPSPINPVPYTLSPPPELTGPLSPNERLSEAERLYENEIIGPESLVSDGDHLYTGTLDGKVLDIYRGETRVLARLGQEPCGGEENEPTCGRPLGMRLDKDGYLIVVDAYLGLFKVNVATGDVHELYSSKEPINGKVPKFLNDLDIGSDGTIYVSDSSTIWGRRENRYSLLEGETTGRVMAFNPTTKEMTVLVDGFAFPNGVQLSKDEDFLLFTETAKCRIWRYWLKGDKRGELEIFVDNLPGTPDNIRRNKRGTFWIGFATVRRAGKFSMVDFAADKPWLRALGTKLLSQENIIKFIPKYGLIVEINNKGEIISSLHDTTARRVPATSEVEEVNGVLYIGSYDLPYLSKLRLKKY